MKVAYILLGACLLLSPADARADQSIPIIEYRALPDIGQVRLTSSFIHDPELQSAVAKNRGRFEKLGIFLVATDSMVRTSRTETIGQHVLQTNISIFPPAGHGPGGGVSTAYVTVLMDGEVRIDCPFVAGDVELVDLAILPVDGMVRIVGSAGGKRVDAVLFMNQVGLIDRKWLFSRAK